MHGKEDCEEGLKVVVLCSVARSVWLSAESHVRYPIEHLRKGVRYAQKKDAGTK